MRIYCKPTYFNQSVERHFSSKIKRKSRDSDLTLELSCHAGFPTARLCLHKKKKKVIIFSRRKHDVIDNVYFSDDRNGLKITNMAEEQQQTYENKNANHVRSITSAIFGKYFWNEFAFMCIE